LLRDTGRPAFLKTLREGTRSEILSGMIARAPMGLPWEDIVVRTGWKDGEIAEALAPLSASGSVRPIGQGRPLLMEGKSFLELSRQILQIVEGFQRANPLVPGIAQEDLRAKAGRRVRAESFRASLAELVTGKKLEVLGEIVRRAGTGITLQADEQEAKGRIETAFRTAGLAVPSAKEVLSGLQVEAKRAEKLLHLLLREKVLVRVSAELIFHQSALAHLKEQLLTYRKSRGERISVPGFKELTGITRKYAIPLLEYLDRERLTRRMGDERVIL
jgi:selenocysteine-specific elongation factor